MPREAHPSRLCDNTAGGSMLIRTGSNIPSSEITDEYLYQNRRQFLQAGSRALAGVALSGLLPQAAKKGPYDASETLTPYQAITTYNNFYEFGPEKDQPAKRAGTLKIAPWTVNVEGLVKKPAAFALDDLLRGLTPEDRIYRMRCVEGWSMVIPWRGIPLAAIIRKLAPLPSAKFVEMKTLFAPDQMPEQKTDLLMWPYTEGLRMDEAMNPLTLIATGIYGKSLLNQNGAPLRLVTPWKYGFKGVKSIVNIRFTAEMPKTAWMQAGPDEYGFYANVNPTVDHPRWSQKTEKIIGQKLTLQQVIKREIPVKPTVIFNGYGNLVASMYAGMDITKNF
jgi:methionine sulfoxide reductase catalytic subunit